VRKAVAEVRSEVEHLAVPAPLSFAEGRPDDKICAGEGEEDGGAPKEFVKKCQYD
jgi:hypothetical protein